jgi:hypothetical protein
LAAARVCAPAMFSGFPITGNADPDEKCDESERRDCDQARALGGFSSICRVLRVPTAHERVGQPAGIGNSAIGVVAGEGLMWEIVYALTGIIRRVCPEGIGESHYSASSAASAGLEGMDAEVEPVAVGALDFFVPQNTRVRPFSSTNNYRGFANTLRWFRSPTCLLVST